MDKVETQAHIGRLVAEGFTVLRSYVSEALSAQLVSKAEALHQKLGQEFTAPTGIQKVIAEDRVVNNVIAFDSTFLNVALTGQHIDIVGALLNDPYYDNSALHNYCLAQANLREGAASLPIHVDTRMVTPGPKTWQIQCVLALSEKNHKSGGIKVVPKSHLLDNFPSAELESEQVNIELGPGDMLIFSAQLHHATHASEKNSRPGWSYNLTFRSWWVKPQFDFPEMLGQQMQKESPQVKAFLGAFSTPSSDPFSSPSMRKKIR